MYNKYQELYKMVIEEYFHNKSSLRKTAARFNIHYQTVYKWIRQYKKIGEKDLFSYKKPWNRIPKNSERLVISYKERYPCLTVKQAQKLLQKNGLKISYHGIWNIWHRYGYCGFAKDNIGNDFTDFVPLTNETKKKLLQSQKLYESNKIRESVKILNSIPCLPKNELVLKIPDEFLNTRRQLEKLTMQFGTIPLHEYIRGAKNVFHRCIKNNWHYSALRIGVALLVSLSWYGSSKELNKWTKKIEGLIHQSRRKSRDFLPIRFTILLSKCHALVGKLQFGKTFKIARYCYRLISQHKKPLYNFLYDLAVQFIDLEDYNTAEKLLVKAMEGIDEERKKRLKTLLAIYIHLLRCDKKTAQQLLKEAEIYDWARDTQLFRFQSLFALIEASPSEALDWAQKALDVSKGAGLYLDIANAYLAMASAHMCLGQTKKAGDLLTELKAFLKKIKMYRQLLVANILLNKFPRNKGYLKLSTIKLAWLLKNQGYTAGYKYAQRKGLMFYFYRYLFFFPEIIQKRIAKNKPTFLPRTILKLPIFNTGTIVYHINFLGRVVIYRNQKYLKMKLAPKDSALLLYIANKIQEPGKNLNLEPLLKNFWGKNRNPARVLSHALLRIKKALKIPGHLLAISRKYGESILVNEHIYFTTDYQEFEQTSAQAKALERAGEWVFAKREYLQAFNLFRGEPFKKNFDEWSLNMRFKILNQLETEAITFAKNCLANGNKTDAKKILQKVLKIMPDSEEIKNLLDS